MKWVLFFLVALSGGNAMWSDDSYRFAMVEELHPIEWQRAVEIMDNVCRIYEDYTADCGQTVIGPTWEMEP